MGHPTGQALDGLKGALLEESLHLTRSLRPHLDTPTPANPLPFGVIRAVAVTSPNQYEWLPSPRQLEHDPSSTPVLATPFTHLPNGWGALAANERLECLSIHDIGTRTCYPTQEGLD